MTHLNDVNTRELNHSFLFILTTFAIYIYASINNMFPLALIATITNFITSIVGRAISLVERDVDEPHTSINIFFIIQIFSIMAMFVINFSDDPINDIQELFTQVTEQFQEINQTVIDNFVRELMGPHMEMDGGKPMPKRKTKSKKRNKRRVVKSNRKTRRKLR